MRRNRGWHRRQLPGRPPGQAGLDRSGPARQGAAAQPRRLHRPRLQLHLPGGPQQGDVPAGRAERQPVPGPGPVGGLRRHRGGPHPRAHGRAAAAHDLGQGLGDRGPPADPGPSGRAGALRQPRGDPGRLLVPDRFGGGLAGDRHPDAHPGRRGRLPGVRQHRGARHHHPPRPGRGVAGGGVGGHRQGGHSGRARGDRLRGLVESGGQHGRGPHPAGAGRSSDGRRGPHRHPGRHRQRDRLPDRQGHGHLLLRAPVGRVHGGGVLRPPAHPAPPRRHPLQRRGRPVAHGDAVHPRRLRPPDGAGHRADRAAGRRRDQIRHQRPAVAHPRRHALSGRDPRGAQPVVRRRGVGEGGPGHGPGGGRVDDPRLPQGDRRPRRRHRPLLPPRADRRAHLGPGLRALQQDLRDRASRRAVGEPPVPGHRPLFVPPAGAGRRVLPGPHLGAAPVVRVQRRSGGPLRRRGPGGGVGRPLVEPDHRGRAPQPAGELRAGGPERLPDIRAVRAGGYGLRRLSGRQQDRRAGRAGRLHPVAHPRRRLPLRPHHDGDGPRPGAHRHRRLRRGPRRVLGPPLPA